MADQTTKPVLDNSAVPDLVRSVFGLEVTSVKALNAYDDLNFHVQVKPEHSNPFIKSVHPHGYTLKVLNSHESKTPEIVEAQHQIIFKLKDAGFNVPVPTPTCDRHQHWATLALRKTPGLRWRPTDEYDPSAEHVVRLMEYVPGEILRSVPYSPTLMYEAGETAAHISNRLAGVDHPVYTWLDSPWFLRSVPRVAQFTWVVSDLERRRLAEDVVQQFCQRVVPRIDRLPQGALHGDLNEQNLLVRREADGAAHVCGVLDLGDSHRSALLFELALVIMYLTIDCDTMERLDVGGHVLAGYRRHRRLSHAEMDLLKTCVCARFAQSLVLGAHAHHQNPSNHYVLVTAANGWDALHRLWDEPEERLYSRWEAICQRYEQQQ